MLDNFIVFDRTMSPSTFNSISFTAPRRKTGETLKSLFKSLHRKKKPQAS